MSTLNNERYRILERLHDKSLKLDHDIRSQIIFSSIMVENEIENIITTHFCRERNPAPLFKSLIFGVGEVTFSKKITILEKILEVAYPDLWKECKWVISRLNAIRRLRNKFAH